MGLKASDLSGVTPSGGPTVGSAVSKQIRHKFFTIARTDTTASVKCKLPANSSITDIIIYGVASDAGTTATVSIGTSSTSTELISGQSVATAGFIRPTTSANTTAFFALESIPQGSDISIYAKYAETGTASSVGNWTVRIDFIT